MRLEPLNVVADAKKTAKINKLLHAGKLRRKPKLYNKHFTIYLRRQNALHEQKMRVFIDQMG